MKKAEGRKGNQEDVRKVKGAKFNSFFIDGKISLIFP